MISPLRGTAPASSTAFLSRYADSEVRGLVKRFVQISKDEAFVIDQLVDSDKTDYAAFSEFLHHACTLLLQKYVDEGFGGDDYNAGVMYHLRGLRQQANRSMMRSEIKDNMHRFDSELDSARASGDSEYIIDHLRMWSNLITNSPSPSVTQTMKAVVGGSSSVRKAVDALGVWVEQGTVGVSEEDLTLIGEWSIWLQEE